VKNLNEGSTLRGHSSGHSVENKGLDVKERQEKIFRAQGKKTAFRIVEGGRLCGFMPWVHFLPIVLIALYPAFL
jgi:hypothetical protein